MRCPRCKSSHIVKLGFVVTRKGKKPRVKCQKCGTTFYARRDKMK